jgi:hypothetical protein
MPYCFYCPSRRLSVLRGRLFIAFLMGLSLTALGCERQEKISRYRVPKEHVLNKENGPEPGDAAPGVAEDYRMLAAIVPHDPQAWFFRLLGPADAVASEGANFLALVKSVHFGAEGTPEWTLPQGWQQKPASGMRYATIEVASAGGPLDLSVTVLPRNEPNLDVYTLSNLNRWRGQLGLADLLPAQLSENVDRFEVDGATVTFVDLLGKKPQDNMSRAPFAGGPMPPSGPMAGAGRPSAPMPTGAPSAPAPGSASRELTYSVPPSWTEVAASGMRRASFSVGSGGEASVISLGASGGTMLPNINRWREQVQLGATSSEELEREAKKVEVGGLPGDLVELLGAEKAILGAVVQRGEQTWFFKMTGTPELVKSERANFESFLQSVKFTKPATGQ